MNYHYEYYVDSEEGMVAMLLVYGLYALFGGGLSIALYVLRSIGTYTIAKRRGLKRAWFAWVPVADHYLLGCISDQYRYVVKGQNKNKRKWLLALDIVFAAVLIVTIVSFVGIVVNFAMGYMNENRMMARLLGMLSLYLPLLGVGIAMSVLRYMALYDLYTSCDPGNKVLYLLLSIFVGITEPFFIFFSRNKDEGMPPRRDTAPAQPVEEPPVWEPAEEPWNYGEKEPEEPFWHSSENTTE